jgi:hypothetical protein
MIWPFPSRGARVDTALPDVDDMPPLEAFLVNDAVIKVWLPAKLSGRVDWLSAHHGASRPDVLRALLFEHVYGRVAMRKLEMFARKRWEEDASGRPMFSKRAVLDNEDGSEAPKPRNVNLEMLGKSDGDFKLHLPERLKTDLIELSRAYEITISHYIRKVLVLLLMGERFHCEWQLALNRLGVSTDISRAHQE